MAVADKLIQQKEKEVLQKKFGEHLKALRLKKGITGAELARMCYIEQSHISRLEKGNINPSIFYLKKICECLGITFEELFKGFDA